MKLEVTELRTLNKIVRPAGARGTCGFSPKPWTAAVMKRGETPEQAFLRTNPKWKESDE